jgi:hypothetical protein
MDSWPPRKVIGQYVNRDRCQEKEKTNPKPWGMMNASPVPSTNHRLARVSVAIPIFHSSAFFGRWGLMRRNCQWISSATFLCARYIGFQLDKLFPSNFAAGIPLIQNV